MNKFLIILFCLFAPGLSFGFSDAELKDIYSGYMLNQKVCEDYSGNVCAGALTYKCTAKDQSYEAIVAINTYGQICEPCATCTNGKGVSCETGIRYTSTIWFTYADGKKSVATVGKKVDLANGLYPWNRSWLESNTLVNLAGKAKGHTTDKNHIRFFVGDSQTLGRSFNVDLKAKQKKIYLFSRPFEDVEKPNVKMFSYLAKQSDGVVYANCKPVIIK